MHGNCPVVFVSSESDYTYIRKNLGLIKKNISVNDYIVIAPSSVKKKALEDGVLFVNENEIFDGLTFDKVSMCIKDIAGVSSCVGWYLQQFLKMAFSMWLLENMPQCTHYLLWDGDTIPLKTVSIDPANPRFDVKTEYHKAYFDTLKKILPDLGKLSRYSFISEHMLIDAKIMREMIFKIQSNGNIHGTSFWEKILYSIESDDLFNSGFSEFETYGTYCQYYYPDLYSVKKWQSLRDKQSWLSYDMLSDDMISWLSKTYDAVSFEQWFTLDKDRQKLVLKLKKFFSCATVMFVLRFLDKIR